MDYLVTIPLSGKKQTGESDLPLSLPVPWVLAALFTEEIEC